MSKKHRETVQKQFTKTLDAFSKFAVRDTSEVLEEKVEFSKPQADDLALDVACGPGALVLALAPRVRFARGVDLTPAMVRQARAFQAERSISNAAFECGEAEQLPYPDAAFDLVTCQCSIHHLSKPELALREMSRVMKPQGRMMLIDSLGPESDAKFELHNRIEKLRDPSHTFSLRLTTYLAMFDELNLDIGRQRLKRRERSFNQWMLRAGLEPKQKRYQEIRQLVEESMASDAAGFAAHPNGDDLTIFHNEGMFMLNRKADE